MDTSEEYINMCLKSDEIQRLWNHDEICFVYHCHGDDCEYWLPRQDQLQEMVGVVHCTHLTPFLDFVAEIDASRPFNIKPKDYSMEQLWLAFVMHNVYGNTWNGKDWVVE